MKKLLLHTCCGPCFLGVAKSVTDKFEVTNYFYNPNIQPEEEYERRRTALLVAIKGKSAGFVEDIYEPGDHEKVITGEREFPARCFNCYYLRLLATAKFAKSNDYDCFSTTLLVSPYQQHEKLKEIGEEIAKKVGIGFYYDDFRPHFREGQKEAKEMAIYRQKYCGCSLSKAEAQA